VIKSFAIAAAILGVCKYCAIIITLRGDILSLNFIAPAIDITLKMTILNIMEDKNMNKWKPEFGNPEDAFNDAISRGLLSDDPAAKNYAGHYMYMFTIDGVDNFKHTMTREYIR